MNLTSFPFVVFAAALIGLYYVIPRKCQWMLLLAASLTFYCFAGVKNVVFILITSLSIYGAALWMQHMSAAHKAYLKEHKDELSREDKRLRKQKLTQKRRAVMIGALLLNFGLLCAFKYIHFAIDQLNTVIGWFHGTPVNDTIAWIVPLGISFYTFQSTGYLVDVYWEKVDAQRSYPKLLLFISFFPQITQGPISQYSQLADQLYREHEFDFHNYSWGFQRMLGGFFKKMVVANMLAPYVTNLFANYTSYSGPAAFIGVLMYAVQIYADFSGYMDIVCGLCEMLDIRLTENFDRPYFSRSIAEYWRRWHISLGAWFKTYLYYPIAVAKWNNQLGKWMQKRLGKHVGQTIPASIALVAVWITTGLWHGASWSYLAWGAVNGLFIIFSLWMEPVYAACKRRLHIDDENRLWQGFQILRTFLLVAFIKVLPEVGTLAEGWGLVCQVFTGPFQGLSLWTLFPYMPSTRSFAIILVGVFAFFVADVLQCKQPVRAYFNKLPGALRIVLLAAFAVMTVALGSLGQGGFMYAQF